MHILSITVTSLSFIWVIALLSIKMQTFIYIVDLCFKDMEIILHVCSMFSHLLSWSCCSWRHFLFGFLAKLPIFVCLTIFIKDTKTLMLKADLHSCSCILNLQELSTYWSVKNLDILVNPRVGHFGQFTSLSIWPVQELDISASSRVGHFSQSKSSSHQQ